MNRLIFLLAVTMAIGIGPGVNAEIYSWVDENGVKHWSSEPPPTEVEHKSEPELSISVEKLIELGEIEAALERLSVMAEEEDNPSEKTRLIKKREQLVELYRLWKIEQAKREEAAEKAALRRREVWAQEEAAKMGRQAVEVQEEMVRLEKQRVFDEERRHQELLIQRQSEQFGSPRRVYLYPLD